MKKAVRLGVPNRHRILGIVLLLALIAGALQLRSRVSAEPPPVVKSFKSADRVPTTLAKPSAARNTIRRLKPLHKVLGKPNPGDWLAEHDEPGQTFAQYVRSKPTTPTGRRTVIYVQPLGEFTAKQRRIVELAAEYLGLYMNRPVRILKDMPPEIVPQRARRIHPMWKVKQILTTYVLDDVLHPRLPADAAAYIAFTSTDLWPGRGWNFVFGQASLRQRVGVWSINRNGNADGTPEEFKTCLIRTLKTATHETGHMFSIQHCTAYECNMCGANHREESDRHPLFLCPECHAKICWATSANPLERFQKLAAFCKKHGLSEELAYFTKAQAALD